MEILKRQVDLKMKDNLELKNTVNSHKREVDRLTYKVSSQNELQEQ